MCRAQAATFSILCSFAATRGCSAPPSVAVLCPGRAKKGLQLHRNVGLLSRKVRPPGGFLLRVFSGSPTLQHPARGRPPVGIPTPRALICYFLGPGEDRNNITRDAKVPPRCLSVTAVGASTLPPESLDVVDSLLVGRVKIWLLGP